MSIVNSSLAEYGHEGGFLNIAYVSGYSRNFKLDESGNLSGFIQQTRDVSRMVPVERRASLTTRQARVENKQPTKVIGRIRSRKITWNNGKADIVSYHAYLDPMEISSPSILDMPSSLAWSDAIKNRKKTKEDDFNPFAVVEGDRDQTTLRDGANRVKIAGIVDQVRSLTNDTNNSVTGVEVLLRLSDRPDSLIPVRMVNSAIAQSMRRELRMGRPILIDGRLRIMDLKEMDEDGMEVATGKQVGYIWCRTILNARRGVDIMYIPPWVGQIMDRYRDSVAESSEAPVVNVSAAIPESAPPTTDSGQDHEEPAEMLPPGSLNDLIGNL